MIGIAAESQLFQFNTSVNRRRDEFLSRLYLD